MVIGDWHPVITAAPLTSRDFVKVDSLKEHGL